MVILPDIEMIVTIVPTNSKDGIKRMPFDSCGGDGSGKLVLMFLSTLIKEMDFVGSGDGNGGIDGYIGDSNSDNFLVVLLELVDFGFREEAHKKFKYS